MSDFDPYHQWLEIPPDEQPPTPHRLLGIAPDETDKETIREAALQRNAFIRQFSLGEQGKIAERLLNEIAAVRDKILAGKVQPAVETPSPVETPIELVVEKVDPPALSPVSPPLFPEGWSIFQIDRLLPNRKRSRWLPAEKAQKKQSRRVLSLVGVIGVFVLVISSMFSGDVEPVASNSSDQISAEMAAEKAAILAGAPITNSIGMTLNEIPTGTFLMGSSTDELDRSDPEPLHKVTISKAFYIQTTEVTQGQWKAVMGTEPWKGQELSKYVKEGANFPAVYVSWYDAIWYCKKLSEKEGKTYRLPTEAEWEYACRAGTETQWSFGDDEKALGDYAWYDENASDIDERYAHQVGLKNPNAFGLYDMLGNVWEWCNDYYGEDYYKQSLEQDPQGPRRGSFRVLRGGSWLVNSRDARSAYRNWSDGVGRYANYGFRLVRELD